MICQKIKNGEIRGVFFRKCAGSGGTCLQNKIGGDQGKRRDAAREDGAACKAEAALQKPAVFHSAPKGAFFPFRLEAGKSGRNFIVAEIIHQEIQHGKNADHEGHIVVGEHGQRQRGGIEPKAAFFDDLLNAECNQRQGGDGGQPHHIPVISDEKATEGIEHAEGGDCRVVFAGGALEIIGKGGAGEGGLEQDHRGDGFGNIRVPKEENDNGQGAGEIVIKIAEKAASQAGIPGINQAFPAHKPLVQLRKQGAVLVVKIHAQNRPAAKGDQLKADVNQEHHQCRSRKRNPYKTVFIEPLRQRGAIELAVRLFHRQPSF